MPTEDLAPARSSRLRRRVGPPVTTFMLLVGIPVLLVGCIAVAGADVGPAVNAALGGGTRGFFIAQDEFCGRNGCPWSGEFELATGKVTRTAVILEGSYPGMRVGSVVPVLDTGDASGIFPRHGSLQWALDLGMLLAAVVFLAAWTWQVPIRAIRRRAARTAPGEATG